MHSPLGGLVIQRVFIISTLATAALIVLIDKFFGSSILPYTGYVSPLSGFFVGIIGENFVLLKAHESVLAYQYLEKRKDHQNIRMNFARIVNGQKDYVINSSYLKQRQAKLQIYLIIGASYFVGVIFIILLSGLVQDHFGVSLKSVYATINGKKQIDMLLIGQYYAILFSSLMFYEVKKRMLSDKVRTVLKVYDPEEEEPKEFFLLEEEVVKLDFDPKKPLYVLMEGLRAEDGLPTKSYSESYSQDDGF